MADTTQQIQANNRISDALIASGAAVPMDQVRWEDLPLEARLRGLRILLDAVRRIRAERAAKTVELQAA